MPNDENTKSVEKRRAQQNTKRSARHAGTALVGPLAQQHCDNEPTNYERRLENASGMLQAEFLSASTSH